MIRTIFVFTIIVFITASCKSQKSNSVKKTPTTNEGYKLGVDEITLTNFPFDTTEIHVELGMPSGDYSLFRFKYITETVMNPVEKIRGLFVEVKQAENKNTSINYQDSLKSVYYQSYAFEIKKSDWDSIKNRAIEIEYSADTAYNNFYCEFCPSYILGYNSKMIPDKLTKTKKVKALFDYLVSKYENTLHASRK